MGKRYLATTLVLVLLHPAMAQVKQTVASIPIGGKLTVILPNRTEYHGHLRSIESDSFSIREVDLKTVLTLRYDEVEKVRKDYGRKGFGGRRVNPRTSLIVSLVVLGSLLALAFIAAAANKT